MSTTEAIVPVLEKRRYVKSEDLQNWAIQIEEMFSKGKEMGPLAIKRQVCRLMASKDPRIAALMTAKWVEWRYGKPKETHEITGADGGPIEHTIRFGDGKKPGE